MGQSVASYHFVSHTVSQCHLEVRHREEPTAVYSELSPSITLVTYNHKSHFFFTILTKKTGKFHVLRQNKSLCSEFRDATRALMSSPWTPGKWTAVDVVDTRRAQWKYIVRDISGSAVGETQALIPKVKFPPPGSSRRGKKNRAHSFICVVRRLAFLPLHPSIRPSVCLCLLIHLIHRSQMRLVLQPAAGVFVHVKFDPPPSRVAFTPIETPG